MSDRGHRSWRLRRRWGHLLRRRRSADQNVRGRRHAARPAHLHVQDAVLSHRRPHQAWRAKGLPRARQRLVRIPSIPPLVACPPQPDSLGHVQADICTPPLPNSRAAISVPSSLHCSLGATSHALLASPCSVTSLLTSLRTTLGATWQVRLGGGGLHRRLPRSNLLYPRPAHQACLLQDRPRHVHDPAKGSRPLLRRRERATTLGLAHFAMRMGAQARAGIGARSCVTRDRWSLNFSSCCTLCACSRCVEDACGVQDTWIHHGTHPNYSAYCRTAGCRLAGPGMGGRLSRQGHLGTDNSGPPLRRETHWQARVHGQLARHRQPCRW